MCQNNISQITYDATFVRIHLKSHKTIGHSTVRRFLTRLGTNRKFPNLEPPEPSIIEPRTTRTYVQNLFPNLEPSIPNLEPLNGRAGSKIRHTDHGF